MIERLLKELTSLRSRGAKLNEINTVRIACRFEREIYKEGAET